MHILATAQYSFQEFVIAKYRECLIKRTDVRFIEIFFICVSLLKI